MVLSGRSTFEQWADYHAHVQPSVSRRVNKRNFIQLGIDPADVLACAKAGFEFDLGSGLRWPVVREKGLEYKDFRELSRAERAQALEWMSISKQAQHPGYGEWEIAIFRVLDETVRAADDER